MCWPLCVGRFFQQKLFIFFFFFFLLPPTHGRRNGRRARGRRPWPLSLGGTSLVDVFWHFSSILFHCLLLAGSAWSRAIGWLAFYRVSLLASFLADNCSGKAARGSERRARGRRPPALLPRLLRTGYCHPLHHRTTLLLALVAGLTALVDFFFWVRRF